jgi:intein/homing endonuclease
MPYIPKIRGKITKEELTKLYWTDKMNAREIGELFGCGSSSVVNYMNILGIPLRDKYSYKWVLSHKEVNEAFFKTWTEEMAYSLGIIVTDGSIESASGNLRIQMTDLDVLEKIAGAMELKNGITIPKRRGNHKQQYKLSICRHSFVEDLTSLGVPTNGTKTYSIGEIKVPKEFRSHFIRGVFDGDGHLAIRERVTPNGYNYQGGEVTIVSASYTFLDSICKMLNDDLGTQISPREYKGGNKGAYRTLYRINFSSKDIVTEFIRYIYADKGSMYMERKYAKLIADGHFLTDKLFNSGQMTLF